MRCCLLTLLLCFLGGIRGWSAPVPGSFDATFRPEIRSEVTALYPAPDGSLYVGSGNLELGGRKRSLIRFRSDGSLDSHWLAGGDTSLGEVLAMALDPEGRLFAAHRRYDSPSSTMHYFLMRLTATGSIDPTFPPVTTGSDAILAVAVQPDGRVLVGGHFNRIAGQLTGPLVRFGVNGQLDASFVPRPSVQRIECIAVQKDGRILAGGISNQLWRLSVSGIVEAGFPRQISPASQFGFSYIGQVAIDSRDRIVVCGPSIHRLRPDGSPDPTFAPPNITSTPVRMVVQPHDRIVFNVDSGPPQRLLEDGTPDASFVAANVSGVGYLAGAPTGDLYIGGYFGQVDGQDQAALARLHGGILPVLTVGAATAEVSESPARAVALTILRKGRPDLTASVRVRTVDGLAISGADYSAIDQRLTFSPGVLAQTITVPILDDAEAEGVEDFQIALVEPEDAEIGAVSATTVRILDDPAGRISFRQRTAQSAEANGAVQFTLVRSGGSEGPLTVRLSAIGGTAEPGADFALPAGGMVTVPPGITVQPLVIPLLEDALVEPPESFVLRLHDPSPGAALGAVIQATATILDTDTFGARAGAYTGVLQIPGFGPDRLTRITFTVAARGAVSGRIIFGLRAVALRGAVQPDGTLEISIPASRELPALRFRLRLSDGAVAPELTGVAELGGASVPVAFPRQGVFSRSAPPPALGRYTVVLPPETAPAFPQGWGWLVLEVKSAGQIAARGRLGDGSALSLASMLAMNAETTLYAAPRSGRDRLALLLAFAAEPNRDVTGSFHWVRAAGTPSSAPWTHSAAVRGSAFLPATALPASGEVHGPSAAADSARVFPFTQPRPGQFFLSPPAAKLRYASAVGVFAGDLPPAAALGRTSAYAGVWMPEENRGYGSLLPPSAGAVELRPGSVAPGPLENPAGQ